MARSIGEEGIESCGGVIECGASLERLCIADTLAEIQRRSVGVLGSLTAELLGHLLSHLLKAATKPFGVVTARRQKHAYDAYGRCRLLCVCESEGRCRDRESQPQHCSHGRRIARCEVHAHDSV